MNDIPTPDSPAQRSPDHLHQQLQEQHEGLRKLFIAGLFGALLVAFALNVFLFRQMIFIRKDLDKNRPKVAKMIESYTRAEEPQLRGFVSSLINYSRTHPDFNPILARYKIGPQTVAQTAPPSFAPAPTSTPAKKK